MKSMLMHVMGVALTFVVSFLVILVLKGMLIAKPPFIVPPAAHAAADSVAANPADAVPPEDTAPGDPAGHSNPAGGEPHTEYQRSVQQPLALVLPGLALAAVRPDTSEAEQPAIEDTSDAPPRAPVDPANLQRLARVYSKMKPKSVAHIMDSLSDENTLAILSSMNDRVAAKVIAGMDPTNAARLSEMLAKEARP